MILIKLLLLAGVGAAALVAFRGARSAGHRALWRVAGVLIGAVGVFSVLRPDALTVVAQSLGVGRGADLVLYVLVVVFLLVSIGLYRRVAELEAKLVELTRAVALDRAATPPTSHTVHVRVTDPGKGRTPGRGTT